MFGSFNFPNIEGLRARSRAFWLAPLCEFSVGARYLRRANQDPLTGAIARAPEILRSQTRSHYEATALGSQSPASTVGSLVLLRLRCYCPPDANPMTRIGDRARMGRRIPGTGGGRGPGDANSKTGSATLLQDKRTGADQSVAGGGESDAGPTPFVQGAGQVLEGFAAYRMMQRRIADAAQRGIMLPFFQPRDGVSGGTIRLDGRELVNFSGYNYLR